jgi:hypothetical protein
MRPDGAGDGELMQLSPLVRKITHDSSSAVTVSIWRYSQYRTTHFSLTVSKSHDKGFSARDPRPVPEPPDSEKLTKTSQT